MSGCYCPHRSKAFASCGSCIKCNSAWFVALLSALVSAGIDTTTAAITNLIWLLGTNSDAWLGLRAGRFGVVDTVTESLRLESPIRGFTRTAAATTVLGLPGTHPVQVQAGERVLVCFSAINRDPARWPEPDTFTPARRRRPHLAYGRGLHACLGQALASAELHAITHALLAAVDDIIVLPPTSRAPHPVINTFSQLSVALRPAGTTQPPGTPPSSTAVPA